MTEQASTRTIATTLSDRQRAILLAVVECYLASGEPVASREIVETSRLKVSSATIRSEFAALTEMGYLTQPHAAAGRIPADNAIRIYAREIGPRSSLPLAAQARIEEALLAIKDELELLLEETSQLLFEETDCVGVVVAPRDQWGHLETVRLVAIDPRGLLVALVFAWGHVESLVTPLPVDTAKLDLPMLERFLREELAGRHLHDLQPERIERAFALAKQRSFAHRAVFEPIERFVRDLSIAPANKIVSAGIIPLASHPIFDNQPQLRTLLRLAQDPNFTPEVFLDMNPNRTGVRVRIGAELGGAEFEGLAMIWAPFGRPGGHGGKVGVFGPSRMPYARAIPLVEYCANLLERNLPTPTRLAN